MAKKKKARSFNSEYYLFSQRQNFSELIKYIELSVFVHYNEILRFRRGKMYGLLTLYAIFVNGFEMQALNHVCILHLIWSWVN